MRQRRSNSRSVSSTTVPADAGSCFIATIMQVSGELRDRLKSQARRRGTRELRTERHERSVQPG
jgi:hypothetical protein